MIEQNFTSHHPKIVQLINEIDSLCNSEKIGYIIPALSYVLCKMNTIFVNYVKLKHPEKNMFENILTDYQQSFLNIMLCILQQDDEFNPIKIIEENKNAI